MTTGNRHKRADVPVWASPHLHTSQLRPPWRPQAPLPCLCLLLLSLSLALAHYPVNHRSGLHSGMTAQSRDSGDQSGGMLEREEGPSGSPVVHSHRSSPSFPCLPAQPPSQVGLSMIGWFLCPLEWDSVKEGDWYRFYHYYLSFAECLLYARPWAECFAYLAHWILMTNQGSRYNYHSSLQKGELRPRDFSGSCDLNLSLKKVVKVSVTQSCVTLCDPMDYSPLGSSLCPWDSPGKNTGVGVWLTPNSIILTLRNTHLTKIPTALACALKSWAPPWRGRFSVFPGEDGEVEEGLLVRGKGAKNVWGSTLYIPGAGWE